MASSQASKVPSPPVHSILLHPSQLLMLYSLLLTLSIFLLAFTSILVANCSFIPLGYELTKFRNCGAGAVAWHAKLLLGVPSHTGSNPEYFTSKPAPYWCTPRGCWKWLNCLGLYHLRGSWRWSFRLLALPLDIASTCGVNQKLKRSTLSVPPSLPFKWKNKHCALACEALT